eukprot:Gb_38432 [translate_table: standard]
MADVVGRVYEMSCLFEEGVDSSGNDNSLDFPLFAEVEHRQEQYLLALCLLCHLVQVLMPLAPAIFRLGIIQSRLESTTAGRTDIGYGNDLLGIMMTANKKEFTRNQRNLTMTVDEIINECNTFFFARHQTTSNLLTWTVFLLAINPQWQTILREEVISVCGTDLPDANILSRLKSTSVLGRLPVLTTLIFSTAVKSCITGILAMVKVKLVLHRIYLMWKEIDFMASNC